MLHDAFSDKQRPYPDLSFHLPFTVITLITVVNTHALYTEPSVPLWS